MSTRAKRLAGYTVHAYDWQDPIEACKDGGFATLDYALIVAKAFVRDASMRMTACVRQNGVIVAKISDVGSVDLIAPPKAPKLP